MDVRFDERVLDKNTGLTLPKSIATFHQDHADPVQKDGSASFSYSGAHGVVTLIIEHRLAAGFPGSGDCTPAVRDNYLQVMHKSYDKTDSERPFRLSYNSRSKRGSGVGRVYHFLSFPDFRGAPAYSEVGVVLVGDFLLEYRGTFIDTAGLADLNAFLRRLGVRKT